MTQFRGRTEDAGAPFLTASFWTKGKSIAGTIIRKFDTDKGPAIVLSLVEKVAVGDKNEAQVSLGASAGLRMAVDASGVPGGFAGLFIDDHVYLECTGTSSTEKGNDQVNFEIEVSRPDRKAAASL